MNKKFIQNMILSLLIPCIACAIQWVFWDKFQPFIWFLFYPSVFFSAQIGGRRGGIAATLISVLLAVFFFTEPIFSFQISRLNTLYSVVVFILMGFLFSGLQENIKREQQKLQESESALRVLSAAMEKRAEADLSKALERLNLATAAAQIGIWDWDIQKDQLVWDERMYKLYGTTQAQFPGAYEAWLNGIYPDDRDSSNETSQQAVRGEKDYDTEFRVVWTDGSVHWIKANGQVFRDAQGTALRMVGVNYDVTESKRTEEQLRESEEFLRLAYEAADMGVWKNDLQTGSVEFEERARRHYGFDTLHTTIAELMKRIHPEDVARLGAEIAAATAPTGNGKFSTEYRVIQPDGSFHWLAIGVRVTFEGEGEQRRSVMGYGTSLDITERKLAEESLRKSEQQFRALVTASSEVLYRMSPDWSTMSQLHGNNFLADTEQADAAWVDKYIHPDDQPRVLAAIHDAIRSKGTFELEHRVLQANGELGWTSSRAVPVMDERGEIQYWFGAASNITERKHLEESLRESEQKYTLLFEKSATPTALLKLPEVVIADANESCEKLTGFARQEMLGKTGVQLGLFRMEVRNELTSRFEQQGELSGSEVRLFAKNGEERIVVSNITPVTISGQTYAISTMLDITERKRAEQALREREQKLSTLLNLLPVGVSIVDQDHNVIFANDSLGKILGTTPEGFSRGEYRNRKYLRADGSERPAEEFASTRAFNERIEVHGVITGVVKEDAQTVWTSVSAVPVDFPDWRVVLVTADITERKRMEDELRRSNAELEQFAYVASHDLQEPLRAVAGMVQLLGQRYKGKLDERADEYIGHAVEASQRMQSLINDLLDYSRVGRFGKPFEPIAVESSLKLALANLDAVIRESQAQVTYDPLPTVQADSGQLTRVLQNLIGNAIKFRGDSPPHVHVSADKVEGAWRIAVSDNGIGIDPQYFERIFMIFQRLHTRREYPGTGIGLSLCKKIIERHGGHIWVESQPEQGSTFYFTLPEKKA